jgi:hypothetical protein
MCVVVHKYVYRNTYLYAEKPFDAKMRQLFQTTKSAVFQLPCVQVICGSPQ